MTLSNFSKLFLVYICKLQIHDMLFHLQKQKKMQCTEVGTQRQRSDWAMNSFASVRVVPADAVCILK